MKMTYVDRRDTLLNRRHALKLIGGAALGVTAMSGIPSRSFASTPQRGGTLKVAFGAGSTNESLDPATYWDYHTYAVGFALGNALVEIGPDRQPKPELAESWESSSDAKTWSFKIRKGVTFHNGKTLAPADVAYSLNRHIAPDSTSAAKGLLSSVTSIRADGDNVIIELSAGDADIPVLAGDFHFVIVPDGFKDWNNFVGTGPYVLESFEPGVRFRAKRNANYWKPDRAWVDAVDCSFVPDSTARMSALISGDVQVIAAVDIKVIDRIKAAGRFNIIEGVGSRMVNTAMDVRSAPFSDPNVRLALKYAIDREEIVKKVFDGYASPGNDHPIPPTDPFFNSELPQRTYDPDRAKSLLKKSGIDKLSIPLSTADAAFVNAVDVGVLMQASSSKAGIDIDVVREPNDGYWDNVWMKKPYVMSGWASRPTPGMMFSLAFACGGPWAESYWCNDKFEQLMIAGKVETDFAKRKQIYWDMQEIASNDGGQAIFAFPTDLDVYDKSVQGAAPDGVNKLMGARICERVWLA